MQCCKITVIYKLVITNKTIEPRTIENTNRTSLACDRRTDRHTVYIYRTCVTSRGKKSVNSYRYFCKACLRTLSSGCLELITENCSQQWLCYNFKSRL